MTLLSESPYEHQLRRFADLLDDVSEGAAELAGGARNAEEILCLARLRSELELSAYDLRHQALKSVPDPDPGPGPDPDGQAA